MKINISINDDLIEKIDLYTKNNYQTRSGFIALCCSQFLAAQETMEVVKKMSETLDKISSNETLDEKTLAELEKFQNVAALLNK